MPRYSELQLDHFFWHAMSTNPTFQSWFIEQTKFAAFPVDLVTDERWHQRWYRNPITKRESETDIFLILRNRTDDRRHAIHIENKPPHGAWRDGQPQAYKLRAEHRMAALRYVAFKPS